MRTTVRSTERRTPRAVFLGDDEHWRHHTKRRPGHTPNGMFGQERRNLLVHDRNLNLIGDYRELRREREGERRRAQKRKGVAVFEDAEDGLGAPIEVQASINRGRRAPMMG